MAFQTDDMVKWPEWLPILIRDDYAYDIKDNTLTSQTDMVDVKRNRYGLDEAEVTGSAVFTWAELTFFEAFERYMLNQGASWFLMPIYTAWGTSYHRVRIKGRPKMSKIFGELSTAGMWVSLSLELVDRKMISKEETELIYEIGIDFIVNNRLHEVMHIIMPGMPGATVISKEFYGTWIWKDENIIDFIPYVPESPVYIMAPTVSGVYNGEKDVDVQPTVTIGRFAAWPTASDIPKQTNNFKYTFATKAGVILESAYKTFPAEGGTITPKELFIVGTEVTFACQWLGGLGVSTESKISFTVLDGKVSQPSITQPTANSSGNALRPNIVMTSFRTIGPADVAERTEVQISSSLNFAGIAASYSGYYTPSWACTTSLVMGNSYYVRGRYKGKVLGWSPWSNSVKFTVMAASISTPVITSPSNGAGDISTQPTISITASAAQQTLRYVQVQVSSSSSFSSVSWDTGTSYGFTDSIPVGRALAKNTNYYVRARVSGSISGWSPWSSSGSFATGGASSGETWNFLDSGTFTPPVDGRYIVEVVGLGGVSGYDKGLLFFGAGSAGGYAKKTMSLSVGMGTPIIIDKGEDNSTGFTSFGGNLRARKGLPIQRLPIIAPNKPPLFTDPLDSPGYGEGGDVNLRGAMAPTSGELMEEQEGAVGWLENGYYGHGRRASKTLANATGQGPALVRITYLGR